MNKSHTPLKPVHFKPKLLVLAVRRALPFLVAFSLGAALVGPAAGRSGENAAAFTATQLIRQFTLKNTVAQVSQGMQGYVQEVNGFLRAPAMGVRPSGFPADMGSVPGTVNLPRRDGAGRPLGYCAWDNASASSDANHLAGSGVPNPLAYAVISPGLNGTMETTCANVLATGGGQGDDFVQVTAPAQSSSKQFRSSVGTVAELMATPAEEGDVRLVAENNKLYSYLGGTWVPVNGSVFSDDSVANGAGALSYTIGKITVADFQATTATVTGALAADSAVFTNGVTAATFTGSGSGLTDLNAGNINSGILGAAFGGTGVDGSAAAQGSLLIGTGAGFALGAITAGDGIGVLNGAGSITISNTGVLSITGTADQIVASGSNGDVVLSLPQSIATTSTPTFAGMMLNGALTAPGAIFSGDISARRLYLSDSSGGVTTPNLVIGLGAMAVPTSGNGGNLAVGQQVLQNNTTGHYNTGLGIYSLSANQTGARNTAVGYSALVANTTGSRNSVVGYRALYSNLTGDYNVAMGYYAMQFSTEGSYNVVLGNFGLGQNTTGHSNSLLGDAAMFNNTTGFENVAVGRYALYNNGAGEGNVAVGYNSTSGLSSGSENTTLGRYSMDGLTTGNRNVALGAEAGSRDGTRLLTSGSDNTFLGAYSGPATGVSTLNFATAIGAYAEVSTDNTIVLGRTTDTTVIGATGVASSGVLLGKKLQVTGDVGITGNFEIGGTFIAPSASFTGTVSASRLDVGTVAGVNLTNIVIGQGAMLLPQTGDGANLVVGHHSMESNSSGAYNTALGIHAMHFSTTGNNNTAVGFEALQGNSSGSFNTAVGESALFSNTTGYSNVAMGNSAMRGNTTGYENLAIGQDALYTNTAGAGNLAIGYESMKFLNSGSSNIGIGYDALENLQSGSRNVAIGNEAGERDGTRTLSFGSDNTFLGAYTGPAPGFNTLNFASAIGAYAEVSTDNTIVLGRTTDTTVMGATGTAASGALSGNKLQVTGSIGATGNIVLAQSGTGSTLASRIMFGADFEETDTISLGRINSSVNNSILQLTMGDDFACDFGSCGDRFQIATTANEVSHYFDTNGAAYHAGALTVSRINIGNLDGGVGDINIAIGHEALAAAQSGDGSNVAIGHHVLESNSTGAYNTAVGTYAMHYNTTGDDNTALGYDALQTNTTGSWNTAIGTASLYTNTTGSENTALGWHAMFFNTTGANNTAVGKDALAFNTTGSGNVALGQEAMYSNSTGNLNVAIGQYALYSNGTTGIGFENTAVGHDAMERLTDGAENTSLGSFALNFLTTGSRNTAIGSESASRDVAYYLTSGSDNSFLGAYSGPASGFNTLNFATAIGAYAQVSTNNTVVLGRSTDTVVIGATGNDASGNKLQVTGSIKATAFNTSSDRRLKNSITQLDSSNLLAQLQQLNAYHYRFNSDPTGQIRYGVIAQEVATLFPHAVSYDGQGLMAVDYGALGAIAATAVGQLSTQVSALDKQVKTNTENITTLTDRMGQAEGKIDALESWKTQAVGRMDNLQTAIDKNIADIAKNAVAITANTQRIDTLEQVTALLDARTNEHGSLIAVLQAQWSDTFSRADDGQTLVVNAPNLKASNFSAQQASVGSLYSERLMAEMAKIKALEVDSLMVNTAQARTVRADEMNTGSAQVYAGVGLPALLFAATADGHYTVNTSALDGSYATATVIVNAGQAKIVPVASEGIELMAEGNTVKAIAAGKSIKASWIKMG